jgi:3-hydroxyacyl-CoA dehydrogenase
LNDGNSQSSSAAGAAHADAAAEFVRTENRRTLDLEAISSFERVGVLGVGQMGASVAAAAVAAGYQVVMADADGETLDAAHLFVLNEAGSETADRISLTHDLAGLADCDFITESTTERIDIKKAVFSELETVIADDAVLTTNTSTIPIDRVAGALTTPERLCGLHFFTPFRERSLAEVVRGTQSGEAALAASAVFAEAIDRLPLVVNDSPGFLVNRFLMMYSNEAVRLLFQGISPERIDQAAVDFGWALGPFRLLDEVGLQTALQCAWRLAEMFQDRLVRAPVLVRLVKAKRLGRKCGAGIFNYEEDGSFHTDAEVQSIIDRYVEDRIELTTDEIINRLMLPMVDEATRVLDEGLVSDPRCVDVAITQGLGFPIDRGGLFYWADQIGAAHVCRSLEDLSKQGVAVGPGPLLKKIAQAGRSFLDDTLQPTAGS